MPNLNQYAGQPIYSRDIIDLMRRINVLEERHAVEIFSNYDLSQAPYAWTPPPGIPYDVTFYDTMYYVSYNGITHSAILTGNKAYLGFAHSGPLPFCSRLTLYANIVAFSATTDSFLYFYNAGDVYVCFITGTGLFTLQVPAAPSETYWLTEVGVGTSGSLTVDTYGLKGIALSGGAQTQWSAYQKGQAGTLWPLLDNALSDAFGGSGADLTSRHIVDMRTALMSLVERSVYFNPATSNPYTWTGMDADNLYHVAMGDRSKYGGSTSDYTWARTEAEMNNDCPRDIDIGEILECVTTLEAAL